VGYDWRRANRTSGGGLSARLRLTFLDADIEIEAAGRRCRYRTFFETLWRAVFPRTGEARVIARLLGQRSRRGRDRRRRIHARGDPQSIFRGKAVRYGSRRMPISSCAG